MSADSPSHSRPELAAVMPNIVTPQPVTDPTILESVAGFINEVVPTAGYDSFDSKDQIQWARFENLDWDEPSFSPNDDTPVSSRLILVIGYTTGVQVWAIPANGEAIELFSWRHGSVKVLRILPAPYDVSNLGKRDVYDSRRPLIAIVDGPVHGSPSGSLNFYSLKSGEQVKQIKFKSAVLDIAANRKSVVITFAEKLAIFDAFTLEDRFSVTTCYPSPGILANPVALGTRWLAFAAKKLVASRRSSGGNEGEGVQSYTATVLSAAKSLGRGLKELGDVVANSLTGNQSGKLGTSPNSPQAGGSSDVPQKGIVTILDVECSAVQSADGSLHPESIVAHFVAHTEAIVALQFGPCGLLLLTADKRGHDFNLFKINPHPVGSSLTAVHHLYTLHRGDTSAKVQDMCFSFDSRWVTVSTLRGTTHVFPITPYGGNIGVRTHTTPHVVNRMSRFHRSAGLNVEGRSNSPVSFDSPVNSSHPFSNPRFAPFPHPVVVNPLAQLRQPVYMQNMGSSAPRQGRQRLPSSSEDNIALRVATCFAPARAWIDSTPLPRESTINKNVKPLESLFIINCHGTLVQYDLEPRQSSHIPKEKVSDDTPIELIVTAKAQWRLQRLPTTVDRPLPISHAGLTFIGSSIPIVKKKMENGNDDDWLSQVEIITHAGPHRRLWMGPQFTFKTYTTTNGAPMSLADAQPLDLNRSKPVNMPITKANAVLIESSSASSSEQSLLDIYKKNCEELGVSGELQIKEDLADAMMESPGARDAGGRCVLVSVKHPPTSHRTTVTAPPIAKVVNPLGTVLTVYSDDDSDVVVPEDAVIYENCDETLFRPLVSPKALAYCKSSKADGGNIMTQSLRSDTAVTVRVMDKPSGPSSWEDPKVQDIKDNTKVIVKEGEVRDLMLQKELEEACQTKIETKKSKERGKPKAKPKKEVCETRVELKRAVEPEKKHKQKLAERKSDSDSRSSSERESNHTTKTKNKLDKKAAKSVEKCEFEDSPYGLTNPLYNLEECKLLSTTESIDEPSGTTKQSKNGDPSNYIDYYVDNEPIDTAVCDEEFLSMDTCKPSKQKSSSLFEIRDEKNILKDVPDISFPTLLNPEFPALEEDFFSLEARTENFEDAEDCDLPPPFEENHKSQDEEKENKVKIVAPPHKKSRKPKAKLGVKIAREDNKDSPEREVGTPECAELSVVLSAPKRSWSSIVAKPVEEVTPPIKDPWQGDDINEDVATVTVTLPMKSLAVKTQKLLDVDTPEEQNIPDTGYSPPDLLKLSDKSSDDEKVDSGSSAPWTTESSDEGKPALGSVSQNECVSVEAPAPLGKANAKRRVKKKKK